jgi:4-methyl-5(b-hydroxyethyl)-thiazole monophosphate biosynthesis
LFLADGFEEIEAVTIVDLLRRANIDIKTVSIYGDRDSVFGGHGIYVEADMNIFEIDGVNAIILPGGGDGVANLKKSRELKDLILNNKDKLIAAICAAPSILGNLKLLTGKRAVCYPGFENQLEGAIITEADAETDGNFVTGKSAATAIPFALKLVEILKDPETAKKVQDDILFTFDGSKN